MRIACGSTQSTEMDLNGHKGAYYLAKTRIKRWIASARAEREDLDRFKLMVEKVEEAHEAWMFHIEEKKGEKPAFEGKKG